MENKQTQNTNTNVDPEVTITLKASEIFQLNLCAVTRLAFVQQVWASAKTADEQNACENQIAYLTNLSGKLRDVLNEIKE